ncbi:MAG: nitrophenyl compound nitroreductase subunit ArsF family protein [Candidatus Omnitrophota bacterium]
MKKLFLVILAVVAVMSLNFEAFAAENKPEAKVIAYYFHGTFRCYTCTNMEKYSREAIEGNFKDALASGSLEFKAVNVEDKGNEHFVDDYQLYTKSLILSLVKDGKEIKQKNLDQIWRLAGNKGKFIEYVTGEVAELLKDVK